LQGTRRRRRRSGGGGGGEGGGGEGGGGEGGEGKSANKFMPSNGSIEEGASSGRETFDTGPSIVNENTDVAPDLVPMLTDKLGSIVEKEKQIMDELNKIGIQDNTIREVETFTSSDRSGDSGDPTEAQVAKSCSDIIVNDITIPVDIPGAVVGDGQGSKEPVIPPIPPIPGPVVEIKYDNVDLSGDPVNIDHDRIKRLMTTMEVKEEVNVIKSNEIAGPISNNTSNSPTTDKSPFSFNNLYQNMNNTSSPVEPVVPIEPVVPVVGSIEPVVPVVSPLQIITEDKPVLITEPKSPRKEMVIIKNEDDIDETSSLANFFDDMKKIVEEKGIKVETNMEKTFTLFEDASEVEK